MNYMKKSLNILFIFMLISQTMFTSVGFGTVVDAEGSKKNIKTDLSYEDNEGNIVDPEEYEGDISVVVEWSVENKDIEEIESGYKEAIELSIPEQIQLEEGQSDSLLSGGTEVAEYNASLNGIVEVEFNEEFEALELEELEGTFTLRGEIEAEEADEIEEELVEEEDAEKSVESKTGDLDGTEANKGTEDKSSETSEEALLDEEEDNFEISTFAVDVIEENIITDVGLTLKKEDGSEVELNPGDPIVVDPNDPFKVLLDYEFEIPNQHDYGEGSMFTIELPELFSADDDNVIPRELIYNNDKVLGTYIIENNSIVITFTDEVQNLSNIKGNIFLETEFAKHYQGSAEDQVVEFPIKDEEPLEFPVVFIPHGTAIDKQGVPYKDGESQDNGYNTDEIAWTVDFNKSLQSIDNAILEDETTGEHTFKEGTLKVYEIHMNVDGTIDEDRTEEITNHNFGESFPLELGEIDSAYRVEYITEIDADDTGDTYKNKATLTGGNIDPVDAEATVSVGRGERLEKGSIDYQPGQHTITWEIKYNYDEKEIENPVLTDTFEGVQVLNADSFEVYEIALDPATGNEVGDGELVENYLIVEKDDGFVLTFDDRITKAYKIIYKTTVDERVEDWTNIKNKVEDGEDNEDEGEHGIGQEILHKSNDDSDYEGKTTTWTVRINSDEHVMNDVTVVDTLPTGFSLNNLAITHAGDVYVEGEDYNSNFDENTRQITITFTEPVKKEVIINYVTDIDYNVTEPGDNGAFKNKVELEWTPEGSDEGSVKKEEGATFNPDDYTKSNGFKNASYNYDSKEITWNIGVNYNKVSLENAVVEDIILGNQNFDIDSVRVYHMELSGHWNGMERGEELSEDDYDLDAITGPNGELGFRVTLGDIDTPYFITYKTDLDDLLIEDKYDNKALVTSDNREDIELDASVSITNGGEYTNKTFNQPGRVVSWTANINRTQSTVQDAIITDTPSENLMILKDTIKLYDTNVNGGWQQKKDLLEEGTDYEISFSENEDGLETFTISFTENPITSAYILEYDTYIMHEGDGTFSNNLIFEGVGTEELDTDTSTGGNINFSNIDGNIKGELGSLEVTKVDAGDGSTLEGAEFTLYDATGEIELQTGVTNEEGIVTFDKLLYSDYILKETGAPEGYEVGIEDEETVTVDADPSEVTIENRLAGSIDISGEKSWVDDEETDRPESITVILLANGEEVDKVDVTAEDEWKYVFVNLPEYDENDEQINYTIDEVAVDGYETSIDGFNIENTLIPTIDISGTKTWNDNADELENRPESITVQVKNGEEIVQKQEVTSEDGWNYTFSDLEKVDADGEEIEYTIAEVAVEGYETTINDYDITNTRTGEVNFSGIKTWKDDNSEDRPGSIIVELLANEEKVAEQEVTEDENGQWIYEFNELPKYDTKGEEIDYSIQEISVDGYEATVNNHNIENLRVGTTEVEVSKLWQDEDDSDRPNTITINLLQNGDFYAEHEVTKENDWKLTITDLPQYDEEGKAYAYTVTEHDVPGYAAYIDGFEVTNTRTDVKTIEISKSWLDYDSEERPASIEVELYRSIIDGDLESVDIYAVTAADDWLLEVEELPAFDSDGKAYTYEIKEKEVDGYETSVNGFELTNLRVGETEVEGTKTWLDDDSENRPESITVQLFANGEETNETAEVTAATDWKYEFTNLDKYDDQGKEIVYTVDEEAVAGYEKSLDGNDITNLRVGTTEVSGGKTWVEVDEQYRPDSITVQLLANGEWEETVETSAETDWTYEFTDLNKYDKDGKEIDYTVEEINVPAGYESDIDGYDITNTQKSTSVSGEKTWKDDNSEERPKSIKVELLANGEKEDSIEVTAENNWTYEFTDLPEYDKDGVAIAYSVDEIAVDGYETTINGNNITNVRTGSTSVDVEKVWENDKAENRPDNITVDLLQNDKVIDAVEITSEDDWTHQFTDLPAYDENGVAYDYTIEEHDVEGYESTIESTDSGYTITNTFIEEPGKDPKDPTKPEEDPKDPKTGVEPKDPGKSGVDPKDAGQTGDTTETGKGGSLPKTATNTFNMILIGGLLLVLGTGFIMFRRKKA